MITSERRLNSIHKYPTVPPMRFLRGTATVLRQHVVPHKVAIPSTPFHGPSLYNSFHTLKSLGCIRLLQDVVSQQESTGAVIDSAVGEELAHQGTAKPCKPRSQNRRVIFRVRVRRDVTSTCSGWPNAVHSLYSCEAPRFLVEISRLRRLCSTRQT